MMRQRFTYIAMIMVTMDIIINGETHTVTEKLSLKGLMEQFLLEADKIAMERNGQIVPAEAYAEVWLCPGDQIEIVHFIGGG